MPIRGSGGRCGDGALSASAAAAHQAQPMRQWLCRGRGYIRAQSGGAAAGERRAKSQAPATVRRASFAASGAGSRPPRRPGARVAASRNLPEAGPEPDDRGDVFHRRSRRRPDSTASGSRRTAGRERVLRCAGVARHRYGESAAPIAAAEIRHGRGRSRGPIECRGEEAQCSPGHDRDHVPSPRKPADESVDIASAATWRAEARYDGGGGQPSVFGVRSSFSPSGARAEISGAAAAPRPRLRSRIEAEPEPTFPSKAPPILPAPTRTSRPGPADRQVAAAWSRPHPRSRTSPHRSLRAPTCQAEMTNRNAGKSRLGMERGAKVPPASARRGDRSASTKAWRHAERSSGTRRRSPDRRIRLR